MVFINQRILKVEKCIQRGEKYFIHIIMCKTHHNPTMIFLNSFVHSNSFRRAYSNTKRTVNLSIFKFSQWNNLCECEISWRTLKHCSKCIHFTEQKIDDTYHLNNGVPKMKQIWMQRIWWRRLNHIITFSSPFRLLMATSHSFFFFFNSYTHTRTIFPQIATN